jgi:two-component system cell cycle sensor histidine kinase/response regulator CckA
MGKAATIRGKVVLLVDDEPSVRTFVKAILHREGFQTIEAGDGIQGFNVVQEFGGEIDLILTDIKMPRMDGVSLAQSARELYPNMPVLFMSAYTDPIKKPLQGYVFLNKPFLPQTLVQAVRNLIGTAS